MSDSIVQEVRAIREQHAASFGYDLDRIYADLKARQERHAAEGWVIISPPSSPPPEPNMALQRTRFAHR
jgi:hypothetical protein